MEENKQNLEFIEPEVKVVAVSPHRVLCQSGSETDDEGLSIENFNKRYSFEDL